MSQKQEIEYKQIPFNQIESNEEENARHDLKDIDKLAENIKEYGLLEPIGVTNGGGEDKPFKVRYGNRRFAALKKLRWGDKLVAVAVIPSEDSILANLIENIHRHDLPAVDLAQRLHDLESGDAPGTDGKKYSKAELAKMLNKSQSHVGNLIRAIKNLTGEARKVWRAKDVPTTVIFAWAGMSEEEQSAAVAAYLEEQKRIEARMANLATTGDPDDDGAPEPRKRGKKDEDEGPKALVKGKTATQMETNAAILQWKIDSGVVKAKDEVAEANGQILLIRFLLGDLARFPSISAAERKEYNKWVEAQQAEAEGEDENEEGEE
jgi:ParB family chromosome partitioning protein